MRTAGTIDTPCTTMILRQRLPEHVGAARTVTSGVRMNALHVSNEPAIARGAMGEAPGDVDVFARVGAACCVAEWLSAQRTRALDDVRATKMPTQWRATYVLLSVL